MGHFAVATACAGTLNSIALLIIGWGLEGSFYMRENGAQKGS